MKQFLVLLGGLGLVFCIGCTGKKARVDIRPPDPTPEKRVRNTHVPPVHFVDITDKAGIHFAHRNGGFQLKADGTQSRLLPETMGSGVAFLDYDGDGRQDILFVNSCDWPGHEKGPATPCLVLYRNKGDGTFENVTQTKGIFADVVMYGMGVTVGDYDNDGWPDLFVTGVGGNRLFHNVSDGHGGRTFEDVTKQAGVGGPGGWPKGGDFLKVATPINWSSSAAWLDYDGDGKLDLFVCNYVSWSPAKDLAEPYTLTGKGRAFGPPNAFEGTHCFLYHNLGNGRFEDVSAKAGIIVKDQLGRLVGKSLAVVVCDVDDDGWPDIVVANDTVRNFFFHNKGDGTFEEMGLTSGIGYAEGQARGAMGADWAMYRADRNADGRCKPHYALAISNFANEPDTFLRLTAPRSLVFTDVARAEGVAGPSRSLLKFGLMFLDYDLDGRPDLLTCNGHLEPAIQTVESSQTYKQPVQLFWNTGDRPCFEPVTAAQAGPDLFKPMVGRGCAFADIDGDGYPDVVLTSNDGPARLLHNEAGTGNHWIRLTLDGDGVHSNRSAIGAKVEVDTPTGVQMQQVTSARGYLSQSELPLTFGLGKNTKINKITIRWPGKNGGTEVLSGLTMDKNYRIRQGEKKAVLWTPGQGP
jgi:enediyne biosynthesis protein E4